MADNDASIRLRIVVRETVPEAIGGVQAGSGATASVPAWDRMSGDDHTFELDVSTTKGQLPLRGPSVQKDSKGRFVYIVWRGGEISRRAKVYLESITPEMVGSGGVLTVVLPGKAKDGLPCCATVRPLVDWH